MLDRKRWWSVIELEDHQKLIPEIEFATLSENSWFMHYTIK